MVIDFGKMVQRGYPEDKETRLRKINKVNEVLCGGFGLGAGQAAWLRTGWRTAYGQQ